MHAYRIFLYLSLTSINTSDKYTPQIEACAYFEMKLFLRPKKMVHRLKCKKMLESDTTQKLAHNHFLTRHKFEKLKPNSCASVFILEFDR